MKIVPGRDYLIENMYLCVTNWRDVYLLNYLCWQFQQNRHLSNVPGLLPRPVALCLRCENNYQQISPDCHYHQQLNGLMRLAIVRTATWDCPPPCSLGFLKHTKQHSKICATNYPGRFRIYIGIFIADNSQMDHCVKSLWRLSRGTALHFVN